MRKILKLSGCIGLLTASLILSGCGRDDGRVVLRMAQASAADGAIGISMDEFADRVEELSEGRIVVHTFHNGQLGSERENIESVQMGDLDMAVVNQSVLINFEPSIAVFDLPYTITSYEHADRVFLGEIGRSYLDALAKVRLKGFAIWESGFRNLTNSLRDVNSVDDVQGLRIRVMENAIHQELWTALGADPVPMSWSDAYTGLQQGAIDGQENPSTVIDKNNVFEVNKHLALTEHVYSTVFIVFSPKVWNSLSAEDRKLLQSCMDEANLYERARSRAMDLEALKTLQAHGMSITRPDKAGFIAKTQEVRERHSRDFAQQAAAIQSLAQAED